MDGGRDAPRAAFRVKAARSRPLPDSGPVRARLHAVTQEWCPSRFNVTVDLGDGRRAVYNTYASALTVVPEGLWRRVLAPGSQVSRPLDAVPAPLAELHERGFLVAAGIDELASMRLHFETLRHDRARRITVNILPTLGCNMRCPYCFEGTLQAQRHSRAMSAETEDALVAYLERAIEGSKGLTVSWFGGEPLLSLKVIERLGPRLAEVCRKADLPHAALLTTNGLLLTPPTVERLVAAGVDLVQVTVDVPADTKRDVKGRDTRETVLDNLVAAAKAMKVHLRINLTRDEPEEWESLYRGLSERGLGKTLKSVNIANVYQPEAAHARSSGVRSNVSHRTYVEVIRRQRQRARDHGLPTHTSLSWQKPAGCAATATSAFTIDPDGFVYRCPEDAGWPDRAFGTVFMDAPTNPENSLPWLTYDWFSHADCAGCPALPQCAGGCPHRRLFQPDLDHDDYCYWFLRGDLEGRVLELARGLLAGEDVLGVPVDEDCGV